MSELTLYKKWLKKHLTIYGSRSESGFLIKVKHTGDVVKISKIIAKRLNLNHDLTLLASIAALFHDVGRFYQWDTYKTYNDSISCDHATKSCEIIVSSGVLDSLPVQSRSMVLNAISEHSNLEVKCSHDADNMLQINILRDSDKISNFPLVLEYLKTLPSSPDIDICMVDEILNGHSIDSKKYSIKTRECLALYLLGWINDIKFDVSIGMCQPYIKWIIDCLHDADYSVQNELTSHFNGIGKRKV